MILPDKYQEEMKELLQDEYQAYTEALQQPYHRALRVNTLKITPEHFRDIFPYALEPVPWSESSFYFHDDEVTRHPFWYAGLYYVQEPSAALPAAVLDVQPGDRVLDLCAAPGGKSTALAAKLNGTGILFSNDYSVSRSQVLLRNLERSGVTNSFVLSESPQKLETYFPHYFDKILVDAPCSGEGMFRKEPHLIHSWEEKDSAYYAPLQKSIMKSALNMLKDDGQLVYSTCTFSLAEDEEVIRYALSLDPSLQVIPVPYHEGFVQNPYGTKLFPHRVKGEGHFVSILQKGNKTVTDYHPYTQSYDFEGIHIETDHTAIQKINEKVYIVPETNLSLKGLRILRSGLFVGEEKKNRMELSGPFALSLAKCHNTLSLTMEDERIMRYLRGETLQLHEEVKDGWCLVSVEGFPLGWGKVSGGRLKNKYPKSWIYHG